MARRQCQSGDAESVIDRLTSAIQKAQQFRRVESVPEAVTQLDGFQGLTRFAHSSCRTAEMEL